MKKKQFLSTAMSAAFLVCVPLVPSLTMAATDPCSDMTFDTTGTWTCTDQDITLSYKNFPDVADGYLLTMIVDGVEKEIEPGVYSDPTFVVTPDLLGSTDPTNDVDFFNSFSAGGDDDYAYRAALFVTNTGVFDDTGTLGSAATGVVDDMSVIEAISGGTYGTDNDTTADGITIDSESDNFNGIMVVGDGAKYTIENSTFNFLSNSDGSAINDFSGYGAVIGAYDGATVEVDNCTVNTEGVARLAFFSDAGSNMLITDSSYDVAGGQLYEGYGNGPDQATMVAPPWVLGITGDARGTNLEGENTSMTLVRVDGKARNWGVVSSDSGSNMLLNMVDMDITLYGTDEEGVANTYDQDDPFTTNYGSGYGTYAIGNAQEYFYGVHMNVGTYATITLAGSDLWYASSDFSDSFSPYVSGGELTVYPITGTDSNSDATYDTANPVFSGITGEGRKTIVNSDAFGIMAHGDSTVVLTEGTEFHTQNAAFLLRNVSQSITVEDGSVVDVADGTILQMYDNDDSQISMDTSTMLFHTEFNEAAGYPGLDYTPGGAYASNGNAVTFTAEDVDLTGNLYNGTGYYGTYDNLQSDGTYSDNQGSSTLTVTLKDNASLAGAIASTSYVHVDENGDQNTYFTIDQYFYLGHVANKNYHNGYNDVSVTLEDGSSWTVTKESLVQSLTVEDGATLKAGRITVTNGSTTTSYLPSQLVGAGTITGEIVLTPVSSILDYLPAILAAAKEHNANN